MCGERIGEVDKESRPPLDLSKSSHWVSLLLRLADQDYNSRSNHETQGDDGASPALAHVLPSLSRVPRYWRPTKE